MSVCYNIHVTIARVAGSPRESGIGGVPHRPHQRNSVQTLSTHLSQRSWTRQSIDSHVPRFFDVTLAGKSIGPADYMTSSTGANSYSPPGLSLFLGRCGALDF
ncbi:hypothetical protein OPQ81_010891 [Rhizoctonia solani]|nr:hypothetical protein OPQ81_010891 [Rhizoctonia solani]